MRPDCGHLEEHEHDLRQLDQEVSGVHDAGRLQDLVPLPNWTPRVYLYNINSTYLNMPRDLEKLKNEVMGCFAQCTKDDVTLNNYIVRARMLELIWLTSLLEYITYDTVR